MEHIEDWENWIVGCGEKRRSRRFGLLTLFVAYWRLAILLGELIPLGSFGSWLSLKAQHD